MCGDFHGFKSFSLRLLCTEEIVIYHWWMRLGSFLVLLHQSTTDGTAMASTGVAVNVDKIRYSLFSISMRSREMELKPTWVRQLWFHIAYRQWAQKPLHQHFSCPRCFRLRLLLAYQLCTVTCKDEGVHTVCLFISCYSLTHWFNYCSYNIMMACIYIALY